MAGLKRVIPYRIRLWWAARKTPVCSCGEDWRPPPLHAPLCPVRVKYRRDLTKGLNFERDVGPRSGTWWRDP